MGSGRFAPSDLRLIPRHGTSSSDGHHSFARFLRRTIRWCPHAGWESPGVCTIFQSGLAGNLGLPGR